MLESALLSQKHIDFENFYDPPFINLGKSPTEIFQKDDLQEMIELCHNVEKEVFE